MKDILFTATLPDGRTIKFGLENLGVNVTISSGDKVLGGAYVESFEGSAAVHIYKGDTDAPENTVKLG